MNKIQVIYAAPHRDGFMASCLEHVLNKLDRSENQTELVDLYQRGFDPVISASDLRNYDSPDLVGDTEKELIRLLQQTNTLICVFPVWMYSKPAMLKGYFEKIWRPNVSFAVENGTVRPLLKNLKKIIVICSAGQRDTEHDDLISGFFERLARQNTCGPASVVYLKLDGRDAAPGSTGRSKSETSKIDNAISNLRE